MARVKRMEVGKHTWGVGKGTHRLEGTREEGEPAGSGSLIFYHGLGVREIMPAEVSWRGRGSPKRGEWMKEEGGAMNKVMFSEETVVGRYHSVSRVHSLSAM